MPADAGVTLRARLGISRHGIDSQSRDIPSPASEELRWGSYQCRNSHNEDLYTPSDCLDIEAGPRFVL